VVRLFGRPIRVQYESDVYGEEGVHREHDGDAGIDLRCAEPFTLPAHGTAFVSCGLRLQLPSGTFGAVRSRSGLASRSGVSAVDGTIDENYRGTVGVTMRNESDVPRFFSKGDRICQLVVVPYVPVVAEPTDGLDVGGQRGEDGFGSTGLK
jgi:dUTP pyrophosphatase